MHSAAVSGNWSNRHARAASSTCPPTNITETRSADRNRVSTGRSVRRAYSRRVFNERERRQRAAANEREFRLHPNACRVDIEPGSALTEQAGRHARRVELGRIHATFELELRRQNLADHHRACIAQMARPDHLPRALVALPRFVRAPLRHRDRAYLEVDVREIGRVPSERRARARRPFDGSVEQRQLVVAQTHPQAEDSTKKRVGVWPDCRRLRDWHEVDDLAPIRPAAAHMQQALDNQMLELQRPVVAALTVAREACRLCGRRVVDTLRAFDIPRAGENDAANQRHAAGMSTALPPSTVRRRCAAPGVPARATA